MTKIFSFKKNVGKAQNLKSIPSQSVDFSDDKKVCVSGVYGFRRRLRPGCLARAAAVRAADNGA